MVGPMTEAIKIGISGLSVSQGTHMCGFFRGQQERDEIVLPFLREGLRSGDKCLWAVEMADQGVLVNAKIATELDDKQLDIVSSMDIYFPEGVFSVPRMLDYWDHWAATSLGNGGFCARAVGEMTRAVIDVMGATNLVHYESELNRFAPRYRQILLCLYDLDHFRSDLLFEIMKTHPMVLMGSTVLENLYFIPPDQWATAHQ